MTIPPVSDPQLVGSPVAAVKKEKTCTQKIIKGLGQFADAVHRTGIVLTGILPFSSRGIILNLALAPLFIPIRLIQSAFSESKFTDKMKEYMDRDWNCGIQDFYIDLETPENEALRKQVVEENLRYASYMYMGFHREEGSEKGFLLSACNKEYKMVNYQVMLVDVQSPLSEDQKAAVKKIEMKLQKIGFKVDPKGNYYNTETGNMFNLVYDKEKKEIIVCFMGLGNQANLSISAQEKEDIGSASVFTAAADWLGAIPAATKEAIKIGAILKKATKGTDLTPVLVGHSHGAGMSQAGAAANGIKGIAFNSRPMGAGTRRYIGQSRIAKNAKHITTFSGKGDWLSSNPVINTLGIIFERLTGIAVQRSVGTGYYLPDEPSMDANYNHVYIYDIFKKLKDMPNSL